MSKERLEELRKIDPYNDKHNERYNCYNDIYEFLYEGFYRDDIDFHPVIVALDVALASAKIKIYDADELFELCEELDFLEKGEKELQKLLKSK